MITYTWEQFEHDTDAIELGYRVLPRFDGVYGVPRGGIPLAVALSQKMDIPILSVNDITPSTLIVDDVIDSGATRARFPRNMFVALHSKGYTPEQSLDFTHVLHVVNDWIQYPWEAGESSGEDIVRRMLEFIGEDPNRPGLIDTPKRVVKMWGEIFRGYKEQQIPDITILDNDDDGISYHDMVIDAGYFFSHCEHHLVPFFGDYYFGYIPKDKVVGLSKIGRLIDYFSARAQVGERLVHQVVDHIEKVVQPEGQILIMQARHLCKEMRGLRKYNSPAEVIAVRGCFMDDSATCKQEFLSRIPKIFMRG